MCYTSTDGTKEERIGMNTAFLPEAFLNEMKELLGDEYKDYLASFEQQPRSGLRANGLKISGSRLTQLLPWNLTPVPWAEGSYYYDSSELRPALHPAYSAGLFYLQEPSAMAPAAVLPVEPGQRVLDLCAAPGGKSTQLAARLKGKGLLVSNDISSSRARGLLKNLELAGASNICVTAEEPAKLARKWTGWFDRILVDAPCSGEGMFRREPDMVKDWMAKGPSFYAPIQREILLQAARMLRPGGLLLYSTCTFSPLEDEGSVIELLKKVPELCLVPLDPDLVPRSMDSPVLPGTLRLFPHRLEGEGHFLAMVRKNGQESSEEHLTAGMEGKMQDFPGTPCRDAQALDFLSRIPAFAGQTQRLRVIEKEEKRGKPGGRASSKQAAARSSGEVYLLPEEMPSWKSLRFLRTGLHAGSLKEGRFEPSQALAMTLDPEAAPHILNLDWTDQRILRYLKGETLPLTHEEGDFSGWVLVLAGGFPLGWARGNGGTLKNKYYPGWRRQ